MTQKLKVCLSVLLAICLLCAFASVVLAEPFENPNDPGTESTESNESNTSSDDTGESSDDPGSSGDTTSTSDTRTVTVTGSPEHVSVYFNGSETPASSYQAEVGSTLTFRVTAHEGYALSGVKLFGLSLTPADDVYSFEISADVTAYNVRIDVTELTVDPPPPDTSELRITVRGAGSVTVGDKVISAEGDNVVTDTVYLSNNVSTPVQVQAALGYRLTGMKLDGATHSLDNVLNLKINETTTLEVTFTAESVQPTTYQVIISCTSEGGYITAGAYSILANQTQTVTVNAGESLTVNVFPADGYELNSFTVGGATQNLSGGSYTLENIAASTTVSVSFKAITQPSTVVEANDFSWAMNADGNIEIDLTGKTEIGRSVFDKINTLTSTDGTYVVLKTAYVRWYIPCGSKIANVPEKSMHLAVSLNENGSYYSTIEASIHAQDPDALFNYYELSEDIGFPENTLAAFNLVQLASAYTGNNTDLMVRVDRVLKVTGNGKAEATGWTTPMGYENSRYMVVRITVLSQYIIEAKAGEHGRITPAGSNSVALNSSATFQISADAGYIIAAVYVDNTAIPQVAGTTSASYSFDNVTGNHTVSAMFIPADSEYVIQNNVAQIVTTTEPEPHSNVGLIVALVIIFVAVAGAAALFIVKWRQEQL